MKKDTLLISILFTLFLTGYAQEKKKKVKIIPFPNLGYSPETRWFVGGVALLNVRFYKDSLTRISNFKPEINFTQNKQKILSLNYNFYSSQNRIAILGENSFSRFPENYWGVGNNTSENQLMSYEADRLEIDNYFLCRAKSFIYAGLRYRLQYLYRVKSEITPDFINVVPGGSGISSGIGYALQYDSRDNIFNAKEGAYISFSNLFFDSFTGSDFNFIRYETDLRKYFRAFRQNIFAIQLNGIFNSGAPPFRMLALLGSDSYMRGYYQGRFRDLHLISSQVEYRLKIWKIFGTAIFAGAGEVSSRLDDFSFHGVKPFCGAGLRIKVDKENDVNLRFDYAIGKDTNGFYVVFGEAF